MNFDKLKNLFTRSISSNEEESFFDKAASLINSSRRPTAQNPLAQFQEYLQRLPLEELKAMKGIKPRPSRTASLRPQLVVRCYQAVPALYFDPAYSIKDELFTRNRKEVTQKTSKMHEQLDQVQLCLFNQISSRFDQILSVLRTIESLECLVDYNSQKLREVRNNNLTLAKTVSERNIKIVRLLKKQERLKAVLDKLAEVSIYASFIHLDATDLKLQRTNSQHYQSINEIRLRRDTYFQLNSTKHFEERVEELQASLKKSYSDSINDAFFKYAIEIFPYDCNFWEKKFTGRPIFEEEERQDADGTVILDQSMLAEEQALGFKINLWEERERQIVNNVVSGWREGEYSTGSIKAAFDKFIKERHIRFNSDCRNFCFQAHIKEERPKIDNPNLANLMQQMNIFFASKTFVFYADMYRNLLSRCFSLTHKIVQGMLQQSKHQLSIVQKQKISLVVDGVFSVLSFIFKTIYEKVVQTVDLKNVYDSMELTDFKLLINVLETEEDFIDKQIRRYVQFGNVGSFLDAAIQQAHSKLDFELVRRSKEEKVLSFLNRTHRYILQNQLRESFQNEVWTATDIPTFYYDSLHYLITGQSLNLRRNKNHSIRHNISTNFESSMFIDRLGRETSMMVEKQFIGNFRIIRNQIIINNKVYKVSQTLLLLLEIVEDYMHLAQFYPFVKGQVGYKIFQLLRAYNTSSHQLIILGGAVKLQKIKTKNITAKHLALNSLCLSFLVYIIECIRNRVPVYEQQRIKSELQSHDETTIKKLSNILASKVAQAVGDINLVNVPSKGTEAIVNSTKILHDILVDFYQKDVLSRIFVRENVVAYLNKLRTLEVGTKMQAESLKDDLNFYFHQLRFLDNFISDYQALRLEAEDIVRIKFQQL